MKRLLIILCVLLQISVAEAAQPKNFSDTYYPSYGLGFNGSVGVYNDGTRSVRVTDGVLYYGTGVSPAKYVRTLPSGDMLFRFTGMTGMVETKYEYILSPELKHMCEIMYSNGNWLMITWLTNSYNEQQAFYKNNKNYQNNGITFDYSFFDESTSSTVSNTGSSEKKRGCSHCGATGIDPTPTQCYGLVSWLAHYNPNGQKCSICGKYDEHYHTKCSSCNTPSY